MTEIISMAHPAYRNLVKKGAEVHHSSLYRIRGCDEVRYCKGDVAHQEFLSSDGTKKVDRYVDKSGNSVTYGSELSNDEWQIYFKNTYRIKSDKDNKSFLSETFKMAGDEPVAIVYCCKKSNSGENSLNAIYTRLGEDDFSEVPRGELFEIKNGEIRNVTPIKYHVKKGTQLDMPLKEAFTQEYKDGKKIVKAFGDHYENHDGQKGTRPIDSNYLDFCIFEPAEDEEENI